MTTQALSSVGCRHRSDQALYEEPHQASDPVAPPCRIASDAIRLKGYWMILDGVRGVLLEDLPPGVELLHEPRRVLGGTFIVPDGGRIRLTRGRSPEPCEGGGAVEVALPEDGPFDIAVP